MYAGSIKDVISTSELCLPLKACWLKFVFETEVSTVCLAFFSVACVFNIRWTQAHRVLVVDQDVPGADLFLFVVLS